MFLHCGQCGALFHYVPSDGLRDQAVRSVMPHQDICWLLLLGVADKCLLFGISPEKSGSQANLAGLPTLSRPELLSLETVRHRFLKAPFV